MHFPVMYTGGPVDRLALKLVDYIVIFRPVPWRIGRLPIVRRSYAGVMRGARAGRRVAENRGLLR
jgi:hypothetical protein